MEEAPIWEDYLTDEDKHKVLRGLAKKFTESQDPEEILTTGLDMARKMENLSGKRSPYLAGVSATIFSIVLQTTEDPFEVRAILSEAAYIFDSNEIRSEGFPPMSAISASDLVKAIRSMQGGESR